VRLALGASARDLLSLTLAEAGALTLSGLAFGGLLAVVLGRMLSAALFGLITFHPVTFAAIGAGMALVSLAAACVPARRALGADPLIVLRGQ
jgi:putative ABC transport system permease protein